MIDTQSDEDLLAAIAAHADRAAFAELFGRFAGRLKAFLIKGGLAPDQAEELAQEVMVTVWRKSASFQAARASASTWIYTIARNRRIDLLRRTGRAMPDPQDPALRPPDPETGEQTFVAARRAVDIRMAMAGLSGEQRQVVELAFFAGLSHGEIAEHIGVPLGTVKSRLRLSFTRLRAALGQDYAEELSDD